jgi:hypothetical protein
MTSDSPQLQLAFNEQRKPPTQSSKATSSEGRKIEPPITVPDNKLTWRDLGRLICGYGG